MCHRLLPSGVPPAREVDHRLHHYIEVTSHAKVQTMLNRHFTPPLLRRGATQQQQPCSISTETLTNPALWYTIASCTHTPKGLFKQHFKQHKGAAKPGGPPGTHRGLRPPAPNNAAGSGTEPKNPRAADAGCCTPIGGQRACPPRRALGGQR